MTDWRERMRALLEEVDTEVDREHARRKVGTFLTDVVVPAFEEVAETLQDLGRDVEVEEGSRRASIRVAKEREEEFFYEVRVRPYKRRDFLFPVIVLKDPEGQTYRAEVFLRDGAVKRDVTDFTQEELIDDLLREYERHVRWHL